MLVRFTGCEAGKYKDFLDWQQTIKVSTHIETVIKYKPQWARKQPIEQKAKQLISFWWLGKKEIQVLKTNSKEIKQRGRLTKQSVPGRICKIAMQIYQPRHESFICPIFILEIDNNENRNIPLSKHYSLKPGSQIKLCKSAPWSNYFMFLFCFKY